MPGVPSPVNEEPTNAGTTALDPLPALWLLVAPEERLASVQPQRFGACWFWLLLIGLTWGLATIGLWELGGLAVRRTAYLPLVSTLLVTLAGWIGLYRRGAESLTKLLSGANRPPAVMAAALVVTYFVLLLEGTGWNHDGGTYLPAGLRWLRPLPWYRALLLCPVWGSWAMLLTVQFQRPGPGTSPGVAGFARGCGPATTAFSMAVPLTLSLWYFNHLSWWQFSIPLVAILTAAAGGRILCRRAGGLRRDALLAVNLVTQIAFLAAYLVNRR
jgi:hypothetical protein